MERVTPRRHAEKRDDARERPLRQGGNPSSFFSVPHDLSAVSDLRNSRPVSLFALPKREMVLGLRREKGACARSCRAASITAAPRDDAWCARSPLSRCMFAAPGFRPAPTGGCQAAAVSFPTLGRAASEGAGTAERPADSCAGAVPSLTLRATVARTSLREQEEGCRGIFLPPFVRCADISPAGGIFPAAFLLGCKTLFFPRRKEKGFS